MKQKSLFSLIVIGSILLISIGFGAQAAVTEAVRVPAEALPELRHMNLHPVNDLNYGSFRWLELERSEISQMQTAGIPFSKVEGFGQVRVMGFNFDPLVDGEPEIPKTLRAGSAVSGFALIQMNAPLLQDWENTFTDLGIELLQYYPHHTYLAWVSPSQFASIEALSFVRWSGRFHPAYKPNENLSGRSGTIKNINVMFFSDDRETSTLDQLQNLGGRIINFHPSQPDRKFFNAIIEIEGSKVTDIARLSHVLWLGFQSPVPILDDEMSDQIVAGNHPDGVPVVGYEDFLDIDLGYDGTGVIWSITDTGVDYTHGDLNTRIVGGHNYPGCVFANPGDDPSSGGHGTHVAGIVGGDATGAFTDGDGFLYGLGMAPAYSIFAQNPICGTQSSWPPSGGWQELSKQGVLGGAIGANNSWTSGEGTAHGYQETERTHDFMVRDGNFDATGSEPYVMVFSAGNSGSGSSTLTSPKEAKNLIVTAGTQNYRVSADIDAMYSSSSRGPAVDGRYVPTIAAPGQQIASTRNDDGGSCGTPISGTNNLYSYCTGTSMAAPHAAGAVVLATEWWRDTHTGATPSPAMAKALLVNGAVDIGTPDIPNFNEGWGRINIDNIIRPGVSVVYKDQESSFDETGEVWTMTVGIDDPAKPLKVSLAWSDAPGAVGANPALVNNLDLEVDTDGSTYLGNDFSEGWSTTGGTADTLNNLENVFVASPGGQATIRIRAINIAGDGVPFVGDTTDQDFALVCFNCTEEPDFALDVTPAILDVCAPTNGVFGVEVGSILGFVEPVTLGAIGEPAGTTIGFSTNPIVPGNSTLMTIGQTGSGTPGLYSIEVSGTSASSSHSKAVEMRLFDGTPSAAVLSLPADGSSNVPLQPTFEWSDAEQGGTYRIQVATTPTFLNPILDESGIDGTSFTQDFDLESSVLYFWRVKSANGCGGGPWSPVFDFGTVALPGDCGLGSLPVTYLDDSLETGTGAGWTHGGNGDTWQLSGARVHSGDWSFFAEGVDEVSEQWLESVDVTLSADHLPLTLQFWNWQGLEDSSSGCYDGGIVEVSTDSGSSWTQLNAQLDTDPYDGPIATNFSNPLGGMDAWCGDPQDWLESVINLDEYAGQTIRFRLRLGTDSGTSREGWYIDDIVIQGCSSQGPLFSDDFETGDTSMWSHSQP